MLFLLAITNSNYYLLIRVEIDRWNGKSNIENEIKQSTEFDENSDTIYQFSLEPPAPGFPIRGQKVSSEWVQEVVVSKSVCVQCDLKEKKIGA